MPHADSPRVLPSLARILAFWGAALLILFLVSFVRGFVPPILGPLVWGLGASLPLLGLIRGFLRADHRPPTDVGLGWAPGTPVRALAGLGLGLLTYAGTLTVTAAVLGPITLTPSAASAPGAALVAVLGLAAVTVMEELAFRSYSLWTALRALGFWPAQLLVAVAFSLLHLAYGWPSSTVLLGVFPSGLLFGVAAAVSGGLALPVGLHLGINLGRWATGEGGGAGLWTLDTSALDPARAASVAPYLGAAVPLLLALGLAAGHREHPAS